MEPFFYLIARSSCSRGGIYKYREDGDTLECLSFVPLAESNWMTRSPDGKYMYATSRWGDSEHGCVSFRIAENGDLVFLNKMSSGGLSPCHTVVSPDGKYLYCANYSSGNIAEYRIGSDGSLSELHRVICHEGSGPRKDRQEGPHTHFTSFTPDRNYLIVIDLGIDAVKLYPWSDSGIDPANVRTFHVPAGDGPRHLIFNQSGTLAYLLNELGNSVSTLKYNGAGNFELLNQISTLPEYYTGKTKAAAIRLSPDGRFLYASNRGFDSIACFELMPETGFPVLKCFAASGGDGPRDINYLPGCRKFAAANEFSDVVVFYNVNQETGMLVPDGNLVQIPGALAIYW